MNVRKHTSLMAVAGVAGIGLFYGSIGCGEVDPRDQGSNRNGGASGGSGGNSSGGGGGNTARSGGNGGSQAGGNTANTGGNMANTGGNEVPTDIESGLIGHWQFEEGTGARIADSSGKDNHGDVIRGGTSTAAQHPNPTRGTGKEGQGLVLNGLDEWARIPSSDTLNETGLNNSVSVMAWVKLDRVTTEKPYNCLVWRHEAGSRVEHFGVGLFEGLPAGAIHYFYAFGAQNVPVGTWTHLAQTYDGITQRVYVNGDETAFLDVGWPITADESPLTIGAGINEVDVIENIAGTVDEVRIYNRALSSEEIKLLATM